MIAGHESTPVSLPYNRRRAEISLDETERSISDGMERWLTRLGRAN